MLLQVQKLLQGAINPSSVLNDQPAVLACVRQNQPAILRVLLNHEADPNSTDGSGWSSLHAAAAACTTPGSAAMLEDLIGAGADAQAKTADGMTPLMLALESNHKQAIELLLRGVLLTISGLALAAGK